MISRPVVDQFNDQLTFTDHALGLEFKDKGRLTEFFAKIRVRFPDSERKTNTIFSSGDRVIGEWTLTATQTEPFLDGRLRKVLVYFRQRLIEHGKAELAMRAVLAHTALHWHHHPVISGSFNTFAFGEIKPQSGSFKDGRLDLIYRQNPGFNIGDPFPLWTLH